MEMGKNFRMTAGSGNTSYVNNSKLQESGITMTKEIIEKSISDLCNNINFSETLRIADLGCSSGPNTLLVASIISNTVAKISLDMGLKSSDIQFNLNDLPSNDFNTLFMLVQEFQENSITHDVQRPPMSCYFTGVPGSFYDRLFPKKSIHFSIVLTVSIGCRRCPPDVAKIVKGSVPFSESVMKANYEQHLKDFLGFLRCRSEEIVDGGHMVLSILGRKNGDPSQVERKDAKLLVKALEEMSLEGLIDEEKVHSFNIPIYTASPAEIEDMVEKEGSFAINRLQVSEVNLSEWGKNNYAKDASQSENTKEAIGVGYGVAMGFRAVLESVIVNHFGEEIVDEIFMRYGKILTEFMSKEDIGTLPTINVTLIKKSLIFTLFGNHR